MTHYKTLPSCAVLIGFATALMILCMPALAQEEDSSAEDFARRIDPTDFRHRAEVRNEYQDLPGGAYRNLLVPRFEYAISQTLSLRAEMPIVTYSSGQPGSGTDTGFGNLLTRIAWRAARGEGYAAVVAGELIFDTASKDRLGSGKNVFAPLAFAAIDLPQWQSVFFPFIQYFHTLAGDDTREDVNFTSVKTSLLTRWPQRTYTVVEGNYIIDHERSDRVGVTVEAELGRFVTPNTGLYVRPGVGVHRNDLSQIYNWNIEVGMRYLF